MTTQDTTSVYRACLADALSDAQMNGEQIGACLSKFDKLTDTGASGETAFVIINESYGSCNSNRAVQTIKSILENALQEANKSTLDKNPVTRLREYIKRFNAMIDKTSVTVDGKEMTRQELDAAKLAVPKWAKVQTEYALASERTKPKLAMTITL